MKWIAMLFVGLGASLAMGSTAAQASTKHHWRHHQVVGYHHALHHIASHHARYRHYAKVHRHHRHYAKLPDQYRHHAKTPARGLVTVETAAGIPITVSPRFAPKMQAFVRALVARGYHPRAITCFASGGHAPRSLHYRGEACDFDQGGRGRTASTMYHITLLAAQFGLRDGCTFRDCGHIDAGPPLMPHHYRRYARNSPGVLGYERKWTARAFDPRLSP